MKKRRIIAVDGHDGTGKTTIAKKIAKLYDMKYVRPFGGDIGPLVEWSCRHEKYEFLNDLALTAVEKILEENKETDLVFDRHWMSIFTILPEEYHKFWKIPVTICCWADASTIAKRIAIREGEGVDQWDTEKFIGLYKSYAEQYGIMLLDTSNNDADECMKLVDEYLHLKRMYLE